MSLTWSHQTLFPCSSNPHHTRVPKPTTSLLKLLPPTLFRIGSNSVSRRNRRFQFHANNSTDSDELGTTRPQVAFVSNPSSSTTLLSFLCPVLKLFSYARIVREALCELELPYILQNIGKGSLRSKLLVDSSGSNEVRYLIDPNTGTHVGDYKKILSYLFQTRHIQ